MPDSENDDSWLKNSRLVFAQLKAIRESLDKLTDKVERQDEHSRDRVAEIRSATQMEITNIRERVAMLELKAKIYAAIIGAISSLVGTGLIEAVVRSR